ncbi:MAG: hypothetical protein AB7S81_01275 [Bdellovibrionales bacterium]
MASNFDEGKSSLVAQSNNSTRFDLQFGSNLFDCKNERFIGHHHRPAT